MLSAGGGSDDATLSMLARTLAYRCTVVSTHARTHSHTTHVGSELSQQCGKRRLHVGVDLADCVLHTARDVAVNTVPNAQHAG
jgi:hypothetical protein